MRASTLYHFLLLIAEVSAIYLRLNLCSDLSGFGYVIKAPAQNV